MGRVYDDIEVNGKKLNTLFDPGAVRSYITKDSLDKVGVKSTLLKKTFKTGLGGERLTIKEYCIIEGKIRGNDLDIRAYIIPSLGTDEKGNKIDVLFGATDMQIWNIQLDLEKEQIDVSRFRKEFIEF